MPSCGFVVDSRIEKNEPASDTPDISHLRTRLESIVRRKFTDESIQDSVLDALEFMIVVHEQTAPRPGGYPYAVHPLRVALTVLEMFNVDDPDLVIAALLHDVVEDEPEAVIREARAGRSDGLTADSPADGIEGAALTAIAARYSPSAASLVRAVTNPDFGADEDTETRNRRYQAHTRELFSGDPRVAIVKMADFFDNALDLARLPESRRTRLRDKYCPVMAFLIRFLPGLPPSHPLYPHRDELTRRFTAAMDAECRAVR